MADFNLSVVIEIVQKNLAALGELKEHVQAASEAVEEASEKLRNISQGLMEFGSQISEFAARAKEALSEMIDKASEAGEAVAHLSAETGMSVEAVSRWVGVAQEVGLSSEALTMGFRRMAESIDQAGTSAEKAQVFRRMGLDAAQLKAEKPEDAFDNILKALAGVANPTERAADAIKLFGRTGTELLPLLAEGAEGLDKFKAKADDLGATMDEKQVGVLERAGEAMHSMSIAADSVGRAIAEAFGPGLTAALETIAHAVAEFGRWIQAHQVLAEVIGVVVVGIITAIAALGLFIKAIAFAAAAQVALETYPAVFAAITAAVRVATVAFGEMGVSIMASLGPLLPILLPLLAIGGAFGIASLLSSSSSTPAPSETGFAGSQTLHVVHIHTDGALGNEQIDNRINQFARGFQGSTVMMGG